MTVDDRPTEPARPPELPKVDIDVALELFEELMVFLASTRHLPASRWASR